MSDTGEDLVPVAMYDSLDDAEQAAKALVARGIGAVVQRYDLDVERTDDVPATVTARVASLFADQRRASEILGFSEPTATDGPPPKPEVPIGRILLIFAVAMIVIPGLAFLLTYNLSQ